MGSETVAPVPAADSELREALGIAGLEFMRGGQKTQAGQLEELALADYYDKTTKKLNLPDVPNIWALGLVLGNKDVQKLSRAKAVDVRIAAEMIATAHGAKLEDEPKPNEVITIPELQLAALLDMAEAGDAGPALELVESLWHKENFNPRWQIVGLARVAAAKNWQSVNTLAEKLSDDPELQNEVRLAALAGRLRDTKPELTFIDIFPEKSSARARARLMVVRAAAAKGDNPKNEVEAWQANDKALGYMGMALGRQDKK
jgi:hypothetical protein